MQIIRAILLLVLLVCPLSSFAQTYLGCDSFTDTNGTALTAHSSTDGTGCPTGASWLQHVGTDIDIENNVAEILQTDSSNAQVGIMQISPPSANYAVEGEINCSGVGSVNNWSGVVFQKQDGADTYYSLRFVGNSTASERRLRLYKMVAGVETEIWNNGSNIAGGLPSPIRVERRGAELKIYLEGSLATTISSETSITGAGKPGIILRSASSGIVCTIDNFKVENLDTGQIMRIQ